MLEKLIDELVQMALERLPAIEKKFEHHGHLDHCDLRDVFMAIQAMRVQILRLREKIKTV